jgi:hypothetical protein
VETQKRFKKIKLLLSRKIIKCKVKTIINLK